MEGGSAAIVLQRYIMSPLLTYGVKWDIRAYVLVLLLDKGRSRVWLHTRSGYARVLRRGGYLVGCPRPVWNCHWQGQVHNFEQMQKFNDIGFAGCQANRRSTPGAAPRGNGTA